jgi:hypothetical protein
LEKKCIFSLAEVVSEKKYEKGMKKMGKGKRNRTKE